MNTPIAAFTLKELVEKLRPARFPGMSGAMAAIVGFILGAHFSEPSISEIAVTSDGFVLARCEGEPTASRFIGSYSDLLRNWQRLLARAELSQRELIEAQALFAAKIGFLGRVTA